MTYKDAVRIFKRHYLDVGEYDYWTVFEMWSAFVDSLCKDGQITLRQYNRWSTPFEYGKRIYVGCQKTVTQ